MEKSKTLGNYAFIDSQNLNLGTQKMGWKMDWRKFLQLLRDDYNVDKAYLFIGYIAENAAMYEQLHELGYLIVLKRTLEVKSHEGEKPKAEKEAPKPTIKGNVDAELVLYAMKEMPNYDKAIVVSGDGDFFALVEYLDQQQKLLKLMVPNWQFSTLLKEFEAYIVRIDKLRRQLAYRSFKKRSPPAHSSSVVK
jgi:uncharacterized LabA/DUF88 family protein